MNLKWNNQNIYKELKDLKKMFDSEINNDKKYSLIIDRQLYLILLQKQYTNLFKLSNNDEKRYHNYFEYNFKLEQDKLKKIMKGNYDYFYKLIDSVSDLDISLKNNIPNNNFVIDSKSIEHIKTFLQDFNYDLYLHFLDIYNSESINLKLKNNKFYNGFCININNNKKNYIELFASKPYYIIPTLVHEFAHTYENMIDKQNKSWLYNINMYMEVFPIFMTLIFDQYIIDTNYYNQGKHDTYDFIKTNFLLAQDLKTYFNNLNFKDTDFFTDFIYFYDSNIALAFLEQYNYNKNEAKKNINYFINHNDIYFSNQLLQSIDINLNKLYTGEYYKEFCSKQKRLIK